MSKLKGVMVGAGYFSQFHAAAWERIDQVTITAICDRDESKATDLAKKYGIKRVYQDAEEMFAAERPDFVDIVTPPASHLPLIRSAAEAKIHVICQKPLADSFKEVMDIEEVVKNSPVSFMVHENWRFQPWYREIKSICQQGIIGDELFHYGFRMRTGDGWAEDAYLDRQPYFRKMPRLLIHETGVHFVDTFRYLEGEIRSVYAQLKTLNPAIVGEDSGLVLFNFESGATGVFDANRYNEPYHDQPRYTFGQLLVEGSGGSLQLEYDGSIRIKQLGKAPYQHPYTPSQEGFAGDSVRNCQAHFIAGLLEGSPFETNMEDYLKTLKSVEAIYLSGRERREVSVEEISSKLEHI